MKTILPLKLFFACWIALLCILLVRANDNSSSPFTADAALGGYRSNSQQTYGSQSRDFPSPLKSRPWHSRSAETLSSLQTLNPAASNALARAIPGDSICGKEDFELSELTASYKDGSFTGNQGIVWTYVHARNAGDYPIEGKGVMLRRADEPSSLSAKLPNGLGNFSVETRKAFTGKTQRKLELVVNDSVVAKFLPVDEPDKIQVFRVDSINVPNEVRVQLRLFGAKGNQQITLDNLKWTCYSKGASGPSTTWVDGRWTNGLPDGDKDVRIASDYTSSSDEQARSITVENGAEFTLSSGNLWRSGDLDVRGAFHIREGAFLIQSDSAVNRGSVDVYQSSSPLKRLDYFLWSTPVAGQNLFAFSPQTLSERIYNYDTAADQFSNDKINPQTDWIPGSAFAIRAPNSQPNRPEAFLGHFRGSLNNSTQRVPISTEGNAFNLTGNPYPSTLDLDLFFELNPNLDGSAYFYTNTNAFDEKTQSYLANNFAVYNATGATAADNDNWLPTSKVRVAQGFIVRALSGSEIRFENQMRRLQSSSSVKAKQLDDRDCLWLELETPTSSRNQMLLGFVPGATNGVDRAYDARQLNQNTNSISSLLHKVPYVIQGRSWPVTANEEVALRLQITSAGRFAIRLAKTQGVFARDQKVFLKDQWLGTQTDLSVEDYQFDADIGIFDERFQLRFQKEDPIVPQHSSEKSSVRLHQNQGTLYLTASATAINEVDIYSLAGKLVYHYSDAAGVSQLLVPYSQWPNGVYIVRALDSRGELLIKKVIF